MSCVGDDLYTADCLGPLVEAAFALQKAKLSVEEMKGTNFIDSAPCHGTG